MKIASVAEVKSQLSAFLKAAQGGPVVVTRNGRPVAAIVGVQDEDEMERLLMAYSPHLRAILDRSRQQFREGQWLSEAEFWSQFDSVQPPKRRRGARRKKAAPAAAPARGRR
jgi:prevent-host-death family protein